MMEKFLNVLLTMAIIIATMPTTTMATSKVECSNEVAEKIDTPMEEYSQILEDNEKITRFIVKPRENVSFSALEQMTKCKINSSSKIDVNGVCYVVIELDTKVYPEKFMTQVADDVEYIQPDYSLEISAVENTTSIEREYVPSAVFEYDVNLSAAHEISTGADVIVAVIDTGIDIEHPDLVDHTISGWDFINGTGLVSASGESWAEIHGTHIAGTIAEVAPDAMIMPLKVFEYGRAYTSKCAGICWRRRSCRPGMPKSVKRYSSCVIWWRVSRARSIIDHHHVISAILRDAVKWELVDRNVAAGASPPKLQDRDIVYLDEEQAKLLLQLLDDEPIKYRTMISLLIYTGLRRGELNGLEWKDIDFDNKILTVCRNSVYIGGHEALTKSPKTRAGKRKMTLSNTACHLLLEYKAWQDKRKEELGDQWVENDRLFTQWNGEPIHPQTISDWFSKFLNRHPELPKVRLHSLRHTNATLLIAEGVDIRTVSSRLGHAQTSTTLNVYSHALVSRDAVAADRLDHILWHDPIDNITPLKTASGT